MDAEIENSLQVFLLCKELTLFPSSEVEVDRQKNLSARGKFSLVQAQVHQRTGIVEFYSSDVRREE